MGNKEGGTVNKAGNYTKPELRKRIFNSIKAAAVQGTGAGQWSARKENKTIYVRLNGTSDLDFDKILKLSFRPSLQDFSNLKFYDYTKDKVRARVQASSMHPNWVDNYKVTYSRSEKSTDVELISLLNEGVNVAVVFKHELPFKYLGFPVINGDATDLRYNDAKGCIVGLKAKGLAKKDTSGFVVTEY